MNKRIKKKKGIIKNSARFHRTLLESVVRLKYSNIPRFRYKQMYITCMRKQKFLSKKFNSRKVEK